MTRYSSILLAVLFSTVTVRADLIWEQQASETNVTRMLSIKVHGEKMRADEPGRNVSVVVNLNTHDSITLLEESKLYLNRFGSEIRWEMAEEIKATSGTNEMDAPPARPVDTGKSEKVNGRDAEIYTWSGAHGLTETLWVDRDFPNYDAIRTELIKLDKFNDSGPHRNAQPLLGLLPGMVIKKESVIKGHKTTTTLVSVKLEPVDPTIFDIPADYSAYKPPEKKKP